MLDHQAGPTGYVAREPRITITDEAVTQTVRHVGYERRGALISWTPWICPAAKEASARGRGMGHLRVDCRECEDEGRRTVLYEPPHDSPQPHARLSVVNGA
jgi:hypothetical protein